MQRLWGLGEAGGGYERSEGDGLVTFRIKASLAEGARKCTDWERAATWKRLLQKCGERERETAAPTGLEVRRPTFEFWLRLLLELCDRGQIKVAVLTLEGRCEGERKGARENAGKQYELPNCQRNLNEFRFQHVQA